MRRHFFNSIRFQIILLYFFILMGTLVLLRVLLYSEFSDILQLETDKKLRLKVEAVEQAVVTYWNTQKTDLTKEWSRSGMFQKRAKEFERLASRLTVENLQDNEPVIVLIFYPDGRLITSSQPVRSLGPLKKMLAISIARKQTVLATSVLNFPNNITARMRIISKPVIEDGQVRYVIEVAASLVPMSQTLNQLQRAAFFPIPIVLLLTIAGALFLVNITLSPVTEMTKTIRRISPRTLKLRLNVPKTHDEISDLAETFNGMLDKMEKSFASQRQIVHDISHELKTPLAILQGQQEVALRKPRDREEYEEILRSNLEEIDKMKNIVGSLLLLAKFDKDSVVMPMAEVELNAVVKDVIKQRRSTADTDGVSLDLVEHSPSLTVKGSVEHLQMLFRSILDNAFEYTPKDGKVTVELCQAQDGFAQVSITDTGCGIPAEHMPYIFDRFYRADTARSHGKNFGLGLSLAKAIAEAHKGRIEVKSVPDHGSTFRISIPLVAAV